jgi:hypothetical protein
VERASRDVVASDPAALRVVDLHTMSLGPHRILVVLGIAFPRDLPASGVTTAVERLEQRVIERLDGITDRRLVVIEPASLA